MSEEAVLVSQALAGDVPAFEQLVAKYSNKVYNYCYRMLGNKEDAEDVAQEVFVKAYRSLSGFRSKSQFSTWLYRIAHNSCIDFYRKKKPAVVVDIQKEKEGKDRISDLPSHELSVEDEVMRSERRQMVHRAIAKLQPQYRTVILLREIEELSYEEIAQILRVPLGTVKSYISRARDALKASLIYEYNKDGI